jgi:tetratricopeptide (TPR) repeat protein
MADFKCRTTGLMGLLLLLAAAAATGEGEPQPTVLPLTTRSPKVLRMLDEAWTLNLDEVETEKAVQVLQKAVAIDPDFAFGHQLLASITLDPREQAAEQKQAYKLRDHASPPERLAIEWWQDGSDHQLISAITKMNDLLSQYPRDRWVVFLATWWLQTQTQYARSIAVYEKSGINSPGLINNTAYCYAYMRQFDKAFALMDNYVAALPNDPNPQDSYAEILRMAGHFSESVDHYRRALAINPQFYSSEFGIADTYSLMGDQVKAREEYTIAFQKFPPLPELHLVQWKTRAAITYVRENDIPAANNAFQAIADYAHSRNMHEVEADIYRQMAIYQMDPRQAMAYLDKADDGVGEGENALPIQLQQEQAQILRARVEVAIRIGNKEMARTNLAKLAELSDRSSDQVIETAYHGAAGSQLFSQKKYDQAISHLEEDPNNALSLKLLAAAYQKIGYSAGMKRTDDTLANLNDPSLEQALVVPAFRKCYEDPTCAGRTAASLR